MDKRLRVFLGGTTNESQWRGDLKVILETDFFDPVVDDWTEEAKQNELRERETCDFILYCLTPKMTGVYSVAEVVDDSNKRPERTALLVYGVDGGVVFDEAQSRSVSAVAEMVARNGAKVFTSINEAAEFFNARQLEVCGPVDDEDDDYDEDDDEGVGMEGRRKKKWSGKVTKKAKWKPPEGLFEESARKIADTIIASASSRKQAIGRVQFYINRAGSNLKDKDKARLRNALAMIEKHYDDQEKKDRKLVVSASANW